MSTKPEQPRAPQGLASDATTKPLQLVCAACARPAQGEFAIHRDGFGEGPEVPLCNDCGGPGSPTCEELWERIAKLRGPGTVHGVHDSLALTVSPSDLRDDATFLPVAGEDLATLDFTEDEKRGLVKLDAAISKAAKTAWESHPNNPKNKATPEPTLTVRELLNAVFQYDPTAEITIGCDGCLYVEDEAIGKVRGR